MTSLLALAFLAPVQFPQAPAAPTAIHIDVESELFIRSTRVVDDDRAYDGGPWSFGAMMERLSGDVPAQEFVEAWISTLVDRPVINGDVSLNASAALENKSSAFDTFFSAWRERSPGPLVDLDSAPFRLLAIVNRPDLLRIDGGAVSSAGEARLIFSAVDATQEDVRKAEPVEGMNFMVIFEFDVPASTCSELKNWHRRWHDLAQFQSDSVGSRVYNQRLQAITDAFTLPDFLSGKVNGSKLGQLRTNEFQLETGTSSFWDLREWRLLEDGQGLNQGALVPSITAQTPGYRFVKVSGLRQQLEDWLNANRTEILAGDHVIPEVLPSGDSFAAGIAINERLFAPLAPDRNPPTGHFPDFGPTEWWTSQFASDLNANPPYRATLEDALVRHEFALQTCAGCHGIETGLDGFVPDAITGHMQSFSMTKPRSFGEVTRLSSFLTGTGEFLDRINPEAVAPNGDIVEVRHQFNDLLRRREVLGRILELDCTTAAGALVLEDIARGTGTRVH